MPEMMPPGQDQAAADADALQRASDQLGEASDAVAAASEDLKRTTSESGTATAETEAAQEALDAAEEALAGASEQLAEAAEQGGGDAQELSDAVSAAEEALAAAEEALAAAEAAQAAAQDKSEQLADASAAGEEEPLPAEEENPSGGGAAGGAAAQAAAAAQSAANAAAGGASGGAPNAARSAGAESVSGDGQPGLVVAVAGARASLEQGQQAIDGAIRALIITGVYEPAGDNANLEGQQTLPGGVLILMPGEPGENEKVAQLEGELDETLIVIDGRLLDERNRLASQRTGGSAVLPGGDEMPGDPGSDAAALLEQLGAEGGESMGADAETADALQSGDVSSADMEDLGDGNRSDNTVRPNNIPEGIPDGSDDDIVARQIREAAMNETDPVLREKLWREYINYKKGGN